MNQPSNSIRSLFLEGPTGRLEAMLNAGQSDAKYAAVVCHPHPMYGGTLHNKVVFNAMKAVNSFGFPALRFNFRGTGLSHGKHDHGKGEVEDVQTALDWMAKEFNLPLILAGFSFGAAMGLRAACPDERVKFLIGLGLPVAPIEGRSYNFGFLGHCTKPKLFVSGSEDVFGPKEILEQTVAASADPKKLVWIDGVDHFFAGKLPQMREAIEGWICETVLR